MILFYIIIYWGITSLFLCWSPNCVFGKIQAHWFIAVKILKTYPNRLRFTEKKSQIRIRAYELWEELTVFLNRYFNRLPSNWSTFANPLMWAWHALHAIIIYCRKHPEYFLFVEFSLSDVGSKSQWIYHFGNGQKVPCMPEPIHRIGNGCCVIFWIHFVQNEMK